MADATNTPEIEIWKPVPSLPGHYASSLGRIKKDAYRTPSKREHQPFQTRPGRILSGEFMLTGYFCFNTRVNGKRKRWLVHRIVCEAFHGAPFEGATVDHLDGDRRNNRPENLEWVTRSENSRRQNADGRGVPKGELHPYAKMTNFQAESIPRLRADGWSIAHIARLFNVSDSIVYMILNGSRRLHVQPPLSSAV